MNNIISTINASAGTPTTSSSPKPTLTSNGGQSLSQADFLKIMVAQLSHQNPLASDSGSGGNSTNNYVTELMSMTNLTTLQTVSKQQAQQLATSLPGATVQVDHNGVYSTGVVQSARVDKGDLGVYFTVNGKEYPSTELYAINQNVTLPSTGTTVPTAPGTTATTPTN